MGSDDPAWKYSPYAWVDRSGPFEVTRLFAHPGPLKRFDAKGVPAASVRKYYAIDCRSVKHRRQRVRLPNRRLSQ